MRTFHGEQGQESRGTVEVDNGDELPSSENVIPSIEIEFGTGFNHEFQYAFTSTERRQEDQDSSEPRSTIRDLFDATPRPSPSPEPAPRDHTPGTIRDLDNRFEHLSVTSYQNKSEEHPQKLESTVDDLYDATPRPSPSPEAVLRADTPEIIPDLDKKFQHLSVNPNQRRPEGGLQATHENSHDITPTPSFSDLAPVNGIPSAVMLDIQDNLEQSSPTRIASRLAQFSLVTETTTNSTIPYKVENEVLPNEPYFDQGFQKALKTALIFTDTVSYQLKQCQLAQIRNSNLNKLLRVAEELKDFEPKKRRTIGLIGDSAAGKSSLINSLLDQPNLAHKGDLGFAVTSFVTEYHYKRPQQSESFVVEVEYLNLEEIDEQLDELVFSSRKLLSLDINEISENELERLQKESELALRTLQSIFPNHSDLTRRYLEDGSEGAEERISSDFKAHARRLAWPEGARDGHWSSTVDTAESCHSQVELFMGRGFWPLIKVVRVFLRAAVLKTGVILADLPGYRDVNLARVKATERYLLKCDEVFIVANINRVLSNKTVETSIKQWIGDVPDPHKNVVIVCTHADVINLEDAEKEFCDRKKILGKSEAFLYKRAISAAYDKSVKEFELAKMRHKYFFVDARNSYVKAELRKIYTAQGLNTEPYIFCIANQDYRGSDIQNKNRDALTLAIKHSGVPELRSFCHSIMAKAKFGEANHYIRNSVFGLVQSLELWLDVALKQDHSLIPVGCGEALIESISTQIDNFHNTADQLLYDLILQPMNLKATDANDAATEASEEWTAWHWSSYAAFARQNGTYETRTIGRRCWNTEILADMNNAMLPKWTTLGEQMERSMSSREPQVSLRRAISGLIEGLREQLRVAEAPSLLLRVIVNKERELAYQIDEAQEELLGQLRSVRLDSTSTHITSYVCQEMIPTYRDCSREYGAGMKARMHATMRRRMNRNDIFINMRNNIRRALSEFIDTAVENIRNSAEKVCDAIEQEIQIVREVELNKGNPEDEAKVQEIVRNARIVVNEIQADTSRAQEKARARGYVV